VSGEDDLYQTMVNARIAARLIPQARLIEFKTGGHLLLGHANEIWPAVAEFIGNAAVASHGIPAQLATTATWQERNVAVPGGAPLQGV
jgi:hypothetical protein